MSITIYKALILIILTSYLFFIKSLSATEISVTDLHLKFLVQEILSSGEKSNELKITFPFKSTGDPHHFSPNVKMIKSFSKANYKILGPVDSQWKKVLSSAADSATSLLLKVQNENREQSSHFWLSPKIGCFYFKQIKVFLQKILKKAYPAKCQYHFDLNDLTPAAIKKFQSLHAVILTHSPLQNLFKDWTTKNSKTILVLKGSAHGETIKAKQLKELYEISASKIKAPLLWVFETQINIPLRVKRRIRPNDLVLTFDSLGRELKLSALVLTNLQNKLQKVLVN